MEQLKDLTMKDLMQAHHDMGELEKDINMLMKFMDVEDLHTFLKIEKEE